MSGKVEMTNSVACPDASLTLKLVLAEADSALAQALWEEWQRNNAIVVVPTLWRYEVTSVLRNQVHRGRLPLDLAEKGLVTLFRLPLLTLAPAGLHQRAWELANDFQRPAAYDAHYLALTEAVGGIFWTADQRLYNSVSPTLAWVRWLGDYSAV